MFNKLRIKKDILLWKAFKLQQVIINPLDLIRYKFTGDYNYNCVLGVEFDNLIYWVSIFDGELSYEHREPEYFKVDYKIYKGLVFEKIVRIKRHEGKL